MHKLFTVLRNSTFLMALLGAVLCWAAQPPLDWGLLGWVAPVPWIWLIRCDRMPGQWPYRSLWLAGFLFWMAVFHFLRLPHPATSIGWVALSAYLAFYLPIFVALSRVGVRHCRLSVILVAPLVWTGLELVRAHLITGITMGSLAYTQHDFLPIIQIASLVGFYGVGFVLMTIAACLGRMLPCDASLSSLAQSPATGDDEKKPVAGDGANQPRWTFWPMVPGVIVFTFVLGYGNHHLEADRQAKTTKGGTAPPAVRVGLIQGSIDSTMKCDPKMAEVTNRHYIKLSDRAVADHKDLDLLIWPETMYRNGLFLVETNPTAYEEWNEEENKKRASLKKDAAISRDNLIYLAQRFGVPVLFGLDTIVYDSGGYRFYNSSVLVLPDAKNDSEAIVNRYDKMHRVLFGEYVPFADTFSFLQQLTPLPLSIAAGDHAQVYEIKGIRFCPNICYENILPHLICRQVNELKQKDEEPDVLVNLTNDGWFWGSSELDLHLACAVFRAVECRKPMLVAANTGLSAWIDANGAILARGPRRDTGVLVATVGQHQGSSPYLNNGDWFAKSCLIFCLFLTFFALGSLLFDIADRRVRRDVPDTEASEKVRPDAPYGV